MSTENILASRMMTSTTAVTPTAHSRIRDICEKSLQDLPVGKDVPRLAKKFILYRIDGIPHEDNNDDDDEIDDANDSSGSGVDNVRLRVVSADDDLVDDIDMLDKRDGLHSDNCENVLFLNHLERYMERYRRYKNEQIAAHGEEASGDVSTDTVEECADDGEPLVLPPIINQITDDELEQQTVVYYLIRTMYQLLSILTALPHATFPSLQEYHETVNINDHTTMTEFLSVYFGDYHPLTKLLKATQQTIVINVLYLAREALMKFTPLHFKDVRGHWRVMVMFHTGQQRIVVCHKRKEEVYMKRSMQEMMESRHLGMFKTLFKFTWRVCIEFDTSDDMAIRDIRVELLDIIFTEDAHKNEYKHEVCVMKALFRQMNQAGSISLENNESARFLNQQQQQQQKQEDKQRLRRGKSGSSPASISNGSSNGHGGEPSSSRVNRGFSVLNLFRDLFSGSQRSDSMASMPSSARSEQLGNDSTHRSQQGTADTANNGDSKTDPQSPNSGSDGFFKRLFAWTADTGNNGASEDPFPVTLVDTESTSSGIISPAGSADMDVDSLNEQGQSRTQGEHSRRRSRSASRSRLHRKKSLYHNRRGKRNKRRKR